MNRFYPYKHWLTTLIIAPFIPAITNLFYKPENTLVVSLLDVYPITFLFSIVFSLPTFAIYYFVFNILSRKNQSILLAKVILIALTVLGISITQLLIKGSMSFTIIYSYSIAAIICGVIWKLGDNRNSEEKLVFK